MRHLVLLILFTYIHYPSVVVSHFSERDNSLGLHNGFGSGTLPDNFKDRVASAGEIAACGSTRSEPSTTPKLEMRKGLFLGKGTTRGEDPDADMDLNSSVEKQRRQAPLDDSGDSLASEPNSSAHPVRPRTKPGQEAQSGLECEFKTLRSCKKEKCIKDGGTCVVVDLGGGKEGCRRAQKMKDGRIVPVDHNWSRELPSCHKCGCGKVRKQVRNKVKTDGCFMIGRPPKKCPKSKALQCYSGGARCAWGESRHHRDPVCSRQNMEHIAHYQLEDPQKPSPWDAEACQGCWCSRRRFNQGYGWDDAELSHGALVALSYAAEA